MSNVIDFPRNKHTSAVEIGLLTCIILAAILFGYWSAPKPERGFIGCRDGGIVLKNIVFDVVEPLDVTAVLRAAACGYN